MSQLGIVVVDEEHDGSFKQEEGIRYHARHVAIVRAQRANAVCVLGSATPALETYYSACETNRYQLLSLPKRATQRPLPQVETIDLRRYQHDPETMLTAPLTRAIEETLAQGKQIILFLNRRGYATFVMCRGCGHAFRCKECSVSLTYHQARGRLLCHYCGYTEMLARQCPCCSSEAISRRGMGTERVALAIGQAFPQARLARLDRDVGSGKQVDRILSQVAQRKVDILVGTQMVTKGHDFPDVTLVGVLCADTGLCLPDFRASERTFQLLTQVAGRSGRGDQPGRVLVQSYYPDAHAIVCAAAQDYGRFFHQELAVRQELGYPPYGHLIAIRVDGKDDTKVAHTAAALGRKAVAMCSQHHPGVTVLGPSEAPLRRLRGRTRWHLWLRASERGPLRLLLSQLLPKSERGKGAVRINVDVDPVSAL